MFDERRISVCSTGRDAAGAKEINFSFLLCRRLESGELLGGIDEVCDEERDNEDENKSGS